jgi:hypothetical protein
VPAGDCLQKNEIFQRLRPLKSRQQILRKIRNARPAAMHGLSISTYPGA